MSKSINEMVKKFGYHYPIYNFCEIPSGRIRDLPEQERAAFIKRLYGQTIPVHPDFDRKDQDFFYISDYLDWKARLPVWD